MHVCCMRSPKKKSLLSEEKRSPEETGGNFLEERKGEINKVSQTEDTVQATVNWFLLVPAKCLCLGDYEL